MERQTELPIQNFYQLSFAVSGHFIKSAGISTAINYSVLGVSLEESASFFRKLTTTLPVLRDQSRAPGAECPAASCQEPRGILHYCEAAHLCSLQVGLVR